MQPLKSTQVRDTVPSAPESSPSVSITDKTDAYHVGAVGVLNFLRDAAHHTAVEHGFRDATIGEEIALMHSELSEALEDHRAGKRPDEVWYESAEKYGVMPKPCGIPSEMADVIIRVLDFCGKHKIDLGFAVLEKMRFNETRPYKHEKVL